MIHRIKNIRALPDYELLVMFDDGKTVIYDVKEDIEVIPEYKALRTTYGLFQQVHIDKTGEMISRTRTLWRKTHENLLYQRPALWARKLPPV